MVPDPPFYKTIMGARHYQGAIPTAVTALKEIAIQLRRIADALEANNSKEKKEDDEATVG